MNGQAKVVIVDVRLVEPDLTDPNNKIQKPYVRVMANELPRDPKGKTMKWDLAAWNAGAKVYDTFARNREKFEKGTHYCVIETEIRPNRKPDTTREGVKVDDPERNGFGGVSIVNISGPVEASEVERPLVLAACGLVKNDLAN